MPALPRTGNNGPLPGTMAVVYMSLANGVRSGLASEPKSPKQLGSHPLCSAWCAGSAPVPEKCQPPRALCALRREGKFISHSIQRRLDFEAVGSGRYWEQRGLIDGIVTCILRSQKLPLVRAARQEIGVSPVWHLISSGSSAHCAKGFQKA